ncbi:MAG: hypothetical protein GWP91_15795 [Rhodobacterales bacterium]|nr:hypothetical protein [Rhodobacterales bacterium]
MNTACGSLVPLTPLDTAGNPITSGGEVCDDGLDNDGDEYIDCNDTDCDKDCDADSDGYSDQSRGGDDCDDADAEIYPGAPERCDDVDNNCHGAIDEDGDGDGADACTDCDDSDPEVYDGAEGEVCDDGVDTDCDGEDCSDSWSNNFESGMGGEGVFGGAGPWFQGSEVYYDGAFAAQSANINNNQHSAMQVTLNFASAGQVSFWHSGSTEMTYDKLTFATGGTTLLTKSGTWDWTFATFEVPAGLHTLEWRYEKDSSLSIGSDMAIVDQIVTVGGVL